MKYKVGDVVKLRNDLVSAKVYGGIAYTEYMEYLKKQPSTIETCIEDSLPNRYKTKENWVITDEMIEGLWEECKGITYEPYEENTNKYKLIDILNKIANGELKEGTKVKWDVYEYTYKKGDCYDEYLERKVDKFNYVDIIDDMALRHLNAEVELIEPQEPKECEHEWIIKNIFPVECKAIECLKCEKCGAEKEHKIESRNEKYYINKLEPTDNTKIEELVEDNYQGEPIQKIIADMFDKLNEVIRKINKEG